MKRSVIVALAIFALTLPACSGGEEATEELPAPVEQTPVSEPVLVEPSPDSLPLDSLVTPDTTGTEAGADTMDVHI